MTSKTRKIGRPTKRTVALDEALLKWVSEARTIRAFCREHKIDSATIYSWVNSDERLSQRLARARDVGALVLEDEIQSISDTPTDLEGSHDVGHRKLQIYAREKRLVWNNPGRYGSKVQVGGAVGLPPIEMTDIDRTKRIKQLLAKAGHELHELTDKPVLKIEDAG
jgi:hypothetical protein